MPVMILAINNTELPLASEATCVLYGRTDYPRGIIIAPGGKVI